MLYSSVSPPIRVSLSLLSRACCQPGGSLHELCCQMPSYAARLRPAGTISGENRRCASSSRCCTAVSVHLSESVSLSLLSRACCQPGGSLHDLCCQMPSYAAHLRPAGTISGGDRRCVSSSRCCTAVSVHLSESVSHTLASSLTGHLSATHLSLTSHTHARTQTSLPLSPVTCLPLTSHTRTLSLSRLL